MKMLDVVNALCCVLLMALLSPVAVAMHHTGYKTQRMAFIAVTVILTLEVVAPVFDTWLPAANLLQTIFNVTAMAIALLARREIMAVVRLSIGKPPYEVKTHPLRRVQDMPAEFLDQIHGRGKS